MSVSSGEESSNRCASGGSSLRPAESTRYNGRRLRKLSGVGHTDTRARDRVPWSDAPKGSARIRPMLTAGQALGIRVGADPERRLERTDLQKERGLTTETRTVATGLRPSGTH